MVRLKIAYWEFDFEAVCPTLDHDLLSQALTILAGTTNYALCGNHTNIIKQGNNNKPGRHHIPLRILPERVV